MNTLNTRLAEAISVKKAARQAKLEADTLAASKMRTYQAAMLAAVKEELCDLEGDQDALGETLTIVSKGDALAGRIEIVSDGVSRLSIHMIEDEFYVYHRSSSRRCLTLLAVMDAVVDILSTPAEDSEFRV